MTLKELYKKGREDQKFSLDENAMWDQIESKLEKPKKKKRFIWFWLSIGILLGSGIMYFVQDSSAPLDDSIVSKNLISNSTFSAVQDQLNPSVLSNNVSDETINHLEPSLSEYPSNQSITAKTEIDLYATSTTNTSSSTPSDRNSTNVDNNLSSFDMNQSSNASGILPQHQSIIDKNDIVIPTILNEISNDKNNPLLENCESISTLLIPVYTTETNDNFMKFSSMDIQHVPQDPESIADEENGRFEFIIGIDYLNVNNSISQKDPLINTWAELHDNSNSSVSSFQLNTLLKYRYPSGLGFGAGLVTRQISEWYDASINETVAIEMYSDSAKYVVINGVQEYTEGSLSGSETTRTHYHTPVRRLYFDIPLEVSYNRSLGAIDLELALAYNLNVSHSYYGRSYGEEQLLLDQNQLRSKKIYKNRFVNSANVGLKINHQLNSSISIGLSLNYWKQLNSSISKASTIEEFYNGFGCGLNMKKTFMN